MNSATLKTRRTLSLSFFIFLFACISLGLCSACASRPDERRATLVLTRTLAGADALRFGNPFGVAVAPDRTVFVTDGEQDRLVQIAPDGATKVVTENLSTPSAV